MTLDEVTKKVKRIGNKELARKEKKRRKKESLTQSGNPKTVLKRMQGAKNVNYPNTRSTTLANVTANMNRKENQGRRLFDADFKNKREGLMFSLCWDVFCWLSMQSKRIKKYENVCSWWGWYWIEVFHEKGPKEEIIMELQTAEVVDATGLSLNSVIGLSSPGTLRWKD